MQLFVHCLVTVLHVLCQFYTCFQEWTTCSFCHLCLKVPETSGSPSLDPLSFLLEHKWE